MVAQICLSLDPPKWRKSCSYKFVVSISASNSTASSSRLSEEDLAGLSPAEQEVPSTMFKPLGAFKQPPPDLLTGVDISGEVFLKPTLPKGESHS